MKLVNFWRDQEIHLGFLAGNEIFEPALAGSVLKPGEDKLFRDTIAFIRAGAPAQDLASRLMADPPPGTLHSYNSSMLAAPIIPSTILCAGSNYREHNDKRLARPLHQRNRNFSSRHRTV